MEYGYEIIKTFKIIEITCLEALQRLDASGGDIHCLGSFIDPVYPDDVASFHDSWGWVGARSSKKILLLITDEISSIGRSCK